MYNSHKSKEVCRAVQTLKYEGLKWGFDSSNPKTPAQPCTVPKGSAFGTKFPQKVCRAVQACAGLVQGLYHDFSQSLCGLCRVCRGVQGLQYGKFFPFLLGANIQTLHSPAHFLMNNIQ